jgi:glycosyltransferase involved in cell wall biosynthesis
VANINAITLLMPVRNGEKFLLQAKNGLFSNCGSSDEILIINDGSTDSTGIVLNSWQTENPKVRVINNPKSAGLVNALNLGISESANKWIARFDVDDSYPHDRIVRAKNFDTNNCIAFFSDYSFLSEKNKFLGYMPSAVFRDQTYLSLVSSQRTAHPSVIFNKEAVLEVGGYRNEDYPAEDISLWLRLSKIGEIETIPYEDLKYRISRNSITGQSRLKALSMKNKLISGFTFRQNVIQECIDSIENTAQLYDEFEYSSQRFLLHVRDLVMLESLGKINGKNKINSIKKFLCKPKFVLPGLNILSGATVRRVYRGAIQ